LTSSLPGLTRQSIAFQEAFSKSMDARVKPGHDECACVDVRKRNSAFPRRDAPKSKLLVLTRCVATGRGMRFDLDQARRDSAALDIVGPCQALPQSMEMIMRWLTSVRTASLATNDRSARCGPQAGPMPTNVAAMKSLVDQATTEVRWGGWRDSGCGYVSGYGYGSGYGYSRAYCPPNGVGGAARYYRW